jgi:hypothetical protein
MAIVVLALKAPRPSLPRLCRRPGFVAGIGTAVPLAVRASERLQDTVSRPVVSPDEFALTITAVWAVLLISRRWRSDPSWIDRVGRALGYFWIVLGVADEFARWLL